MRSIILPLLLCFCIQGAFAQHFEITGTVRDAGTQKVCEWTNIVLQTQDSLFVGGTTTSSSGKFRFEKVTAGDYRIVISCIGYIAQTVELPGVDSDRPLGDILLEEDAVALNEVTVTASNASSDKRIIFPSTRQSEAATNGVNLLQQLMLPGVRVNPLLDEVSLPGEGVLQFRINGVEVELAEIKALVPAEIIRIEHYDNPGLRYGNADVVLNYIVRRPESGGTFGVDLSDAFKLPIWGNNALSAKVNHRKSEFSLNYSMRHRDFDEVSRDNEETFTFLDGSVLHRIEAGESGKVTARWQTLNATYSFVEEDKRIFKSTFRYAHDYNPHGDYTGYMYNTADIDDIVYMVDNTSNKSGRPSLDLYYQENLKNNQTLVFNLVGTYQKTQSDRFYQETRDGQIITHVNNRVDGERYSFIGEGIYEKRFGANRISAGIRHTLSTTDNDYRKGGQNTRMNQSITYAYGEFRGKTGNLDYTVGVGATRSGLRQKGKESYADYTFNPRISLHYALSGQSFVRLNAGLYNNNPSLSNLSAVEQEIDALQVQRGNPNLKPYKTYMLDLTYEIQKGIFYGNLWGQYAKQQDVIMEEKLWEDNKIIQTWDNQKNWQRLRTRATVRVGPLMDIFQFSMTGGFNRYISHGRRYTHTLSNWYTNVEMTATYRKFMLAFGLQTHYDRFFGETLSVGENVHYLMLQYNFKNASVGVGALNPFVDNYKTEMENRSRYASFRRTYYIGESSRLYMAKFTYNFSFGRKFDSGQKRLDNHDSESGVMSTGK